MKTIHRGLLIVAVVILLLLTLENILAFWLMKELGVPRAIWIAAIEFSLFVFLSIVLIRRVHLWPSRIELKNNEK